MIQSSNVGTVARLTVRNYRQYSVAAAVKEIYNNRDAFRIQ